MSAAVLGGDEGAQLSGLQGFEIDDALGLRPFRQRGEVAAVGVERVRGHAALDFEVGEVVGDGGVHGAAALRSEEHTSELQSLMRISYAVFCLKTKTTQYKQHQQDT